MSKFVLEDLNDVNGDADFSKILEDGFCYWNEFCKEIEDKTNWADELDELKAVMDDVANGLLLPKWKFRRYKGISDTFEAKTDNLRAYILKDESGFILINASKKSDQDKGINKYKAITKRYIEDKKDVKRKGSK